MVTVPSPTWPRAFWPQPQTLPSDFRATLWKFPAATDITPLNPATGAGAVRLLLVPSPTWPKAL